MRIMKRSGEEQRFDISKIIRAIEKANAEVPAASKIAHEEVVKIADTVQNRCESLGRIIQIEEIQDMVEDELMKLTATRLKSLYLPAHISPTDINAAL